MQINYYFRSYRAKLAVIVVLSPVTIPEMCVVYYDGFLARVVVTWSG